MDQHSTNIMGKYNVVQVTEPVALAEGLHWDADRQLLYFVDITKSTINVYNPSTGEHNYTQVDGEGKVTFIFPVKNRLNSFIVSTGIEIRYVEWDLQTNSTLKSSKVIKTVIQEKGSRFNDGKVDNFGTIWAGTMGPEPVPTKVERVNSKLFSYNICMDKLQAHVENIYISNGLAWTSNNRYMYYTDTGENTIERFDFNPRGPQLSNRIRIFNFDEHNIKGKTDGMTIDTEGNLYLACYGGYQVIVINPNTQKIIDRIEVPAAEVTTVTFGGKDLNDLYIATSRKGANEQELKNYPNTGAVFCVKNYKACGFPGNPVPNNRLFD